MNKIDLESSILPEGQIFYVIAIKIQQMCPRDIELSMLDVQLEALILILSFKESSSFPTNIQNSYWFVNFNIDDDEQDTKKGIGALS